MAKDSHDMLTKNSNYLKNVSLETLENLKIKLVPSVQKFFAFNKRMLCHMSLVHELHDSESWTNKLNITSEEKINMKKYKNICPYCKDIFSTNKRMKCHMDFSHGLILQRRKQCHKSVLHVKNLLNTLAHCTV